MSQNIVLFAQQVGIDIREINSKLKVVEQGLNNAIDATDLQNAIQEVKNLITPLEATLQDAATKAQSAETKATSNETQIGEVGKKVDANSQSINTITGEVTQLNEETNRLKQALNGVITSNDVNSIVDNAKQELTASIRQVREDILGPDVPDHLDTIKEIATFIDQLQAGDASQALLTKLTELRTALEQLQNDKSSEENVNYVEYYTTSRDTI